MRISTFLLTMGVSFCLFSAVLSQAIDFTKNSSVDSVTDSTKAVTVPWTVLVYICADNNLAPYASYNMNDMSAGLVSSDGVNVLVQWDKPADRQTWRYKITPGGKIDAGTLSSEMGYNPAQELLNAMQWAIKNYPAQRYALILWDHGSGIEDFYPGSRRSMFDNAAWSLLESESSERGILYDDSQKTCLTNQGLTSVLGSIKQVLGRNLDILAMDACLMAMVEVAYQMKDLVNLFVGSQQTIPGEGFPYSGFLRPLSLNPAAMSPLLLAQTMVSSYGNFYTREMPVSDFTLSVIDVTEINALKQNIDQFIMAVAACAKIDAIKTKNILVAARKATISFEMPEYIDLYSFYANVLKETKKISPKSVFILEKNNKKQKLKPVAKNYQVVLNALNAVVLDGLSKISKAVLQGVAGPAYSGVKGISVYYPRSGAIHPSYPKTLFAKSSAWTKFIQMYR